MKFREYLEEQAAKKGGRIQKSMNGTPTPCCAGCGGDHVHDFISLCKACWGRVQGGDAVAQQVTGTDIRSASFNVREPEGKTAGSVGPRSAGVHTSMAGINVPVEPKTHGQGESGPKSGHGASYVGDEPASKTSRNAGRARS